MTNSFNLNNQQIKQIFDLVIEAGEIAIRGFYAKDYQTKIKKDNSKVTSIDLEISEFITSGLNKILPNIEVISEEGQKINNSHSRFFLVDPIDGTSSFINGGNEFSINIALIDNCQAIFGMIYAPLFQGGRMVFCDEKKQVWLYQNDLNVEQIIKRNSSKPDQVRLISSRGADEYKIEEFMNKNLNDHQNFKIEKYSSAIKFIIILTNQADLYLHLKKSMEWDTAAGQALVEMLGGQMQVIDLNRIDCQILDNLSYGKKDFLNPCFLVSFLK